MRILYGMFNLHDVIWAAPLGDQRRNARLLEIVTGLIQSGEPQAEDAVHAPGEATPWAHTMGCFRFYRNDALALPALYEPCRAALAELVPPGRRAYVICDISTVDYSHHATKPDRIQVGNERGRGYELFSALVVDDAGRPLGPVAQEVHTADGCLSSEAWEPLPFVNHYEQVERAMRAADLHLPGRDLVGVMDREFDDLALERWFGDTSRQWVIRAQHLNRKVLLWGRPTTLRNAVRSAPRSVVGTVEREGKSYELRMAETFVDFHGRSHRSRRPGDRPKKRVPLSVRVVIAELYRGGRRAHQWVLLTNLEEPAEQIARIYTWRWRVERLFFFIKVGMRLETWGEQDGLRIARRLALCSLAAMAIYQLRAASGDAAHAEVIRRIATLGGWLGRKRDPIGPVVLMRGMLRFLGTLALLDQFGIDGVWNMARSLSEALGLPLPGVSKPFRKPRRSSRPAPSARPVANV
jgi:hypothetical protein